MVDASLKRQLEKKSLNFRGNCYPEKNLHDVSI